MADNYGGFAGVYEQTETNTDSLDANGNKILSFPVRLMLDAINTTPVSIDGEPTTIITDVTPGPYNNTGIPGAKSFHLLSDSYGDLAGLSTGTANPYFTRIASSATASPIADAISQNPTFFSLWIGANDVLGYATDGGAPDGDFITDIATFTGAYSLLVSSLTTNGAKGLLTNIPNITSLPFFTTVPSNPIDLSEETSEELATKLANGGTSNADAIAALNSAEAYGGYNFGLTQLQAAGVISETELNSRLITFSDSEKNAVVILDENLTDLTGINPALRNIRQATANDLLLITTRALIGTPVNPEDANSTVYGISEPLADKWVLTPEEQEEIQTATTAFNEVITATATDNDLALYDAASRVDELTDEGISVNGSLITNAYVTGGFFSLDGIHLSPKGNGITANEMIKAINEKYGSTLELIQTRDLPSVYIK